MMQLYLNKDDVVQIIIGAFTIAVPISFTEEVWEIAETLPLLNLSLTVALSIFFLSLYAYQNVFQGNIKSRILVFVFRILVAYFATLLVASTILFSIDKFPIFNYPVIAFKRVLVISMPASIGAIVVDGFDKE